MQVGKWGSRDVIQLEVARHIDDVGCVKMRNLSLAPPLMKRGVDDGECHVVEEELARIRQSATGMSTQKDEYTLNKRRRAVSNPLMGAMDSALREEEDDFETLRANMENELDVSLGRRNVESPAQILPQFVGTPTSGGKELKEKLPMQAFMDEFETEAWGLVIPACHVHLRGRKHKQSDARARTRTRTRTRTGSSRVFNFKLASHIDSYMSVVRICARRLSMAIRNM